MSLRDAQMPYIHLVDSGISDNLGLRAIIDHFKNLAPPILEEPRLGNISQKTLYRLQINLQGIEALGVEIG